MSVNTLPIGEDIFTTESTRELTILNLCYTAFIKGRDGHDWVNDTLPTIKAALTRMKDADMESFLEAIGKRV